MASGIGAVLDGRAARTSRRTPIGSARTRRATWSRCQADQADAVLARAREASVLVSRIGTTGGDVLALPGEVPVPVATLRERFEGWLPAYMAGNI